MDPSLGSSGGDAREDEEVDLVSDIGTPGPFSVSTRVGIMAALLGFRRTTFTELLLAVKTPKSSLNKNLKILEDYEFIRRRKGFLRFAGPRTIIEITPKGDDGIRRHLELMRAVADKYLGSAERGTK